MIQPDTQVYHSFVVKDIIDTGKKFNSAAGERMKFTIIFGDVDYKAEYCPLVGKFDKELVKVGQKLTFKIVYRKQYGDEIEPVQTTAPPSPIGMPPQPIRIATMQGHPATIAIMAAKDVWCKKKEYNMELPLSEMLEDADAIYNFLTSKFEQP